MDGRPETQPVEDVTFHGDAWRVSRRVRASASCKSNPVKTGGNAMRKVFVAAVVFVTVMAALVVASESARATYPGATNGRVAFGLSVNGNVDVYSMLPNGNDLRRLTDDPSFESCSAYSPDGKWIAYCSGQSGNFEIWKMKQNGKQRQQVTHTGGRMIFPDFSPDGTKIVFSGHLPGGTNEDIFVANADGSGPVHQLTTSPGNDA